MIKIKNKSKYFPMVFASLMLTMSLLSSMFSNLIPFVLGSSFLKIDISITFIFFAFTISGWRYGLIILMANFLIHPMLPGTNIGFIELFYIGKLIYVVTCIFYIFISKLVYKLLNNSALLYVLAISSLLTTIIMTILNGVLFTPIFLNIISNGLYSLNFIELIKQYSGNKGLQLIFIMPNYWGGIFFVYGFFNIISLSLNSLFFWIIIVKIKQNLIF